jgi:tetratricopeptide (TPR) repeat protein
MARFDRALDQAAAEQRVYEAVRAQGLLVYATVLGSQDREKEGKQMVEKAILGLGSLVPEYPKMADILAQLFGVMSVTAEKEDAAWLVGLTDRTIPFLEAAVRRAPRIDNVRICLCHALGVRALEGKLHLGRGEEALQDLDRAIALCDRPPMAHLGSLHRLNRAAVLATLGRREEALAAVRTELNAPDPLVQAGRTGRGDRLLVAGYVYAVAAEKAAGDLHLSEADRRAKADELATQAVAYLRDAHKAGFVFLGALATAERTRKNPAYALFKDRADFQTLLQEIGRGNPGR